MSKEFLTPCEHWEGFSKCWTSVFYTR